MAEPLSNWPYKKCTLHGHVGQCSFPAEIGYPERGSATAGVAATSRSTGADPCPVGVRRSTREARPASSCPRRSSTAPGAPARAGARVVATMPSATRRTRRARSHPHENFGRRDRRACRMCRAPTTIPVGGQPAELRTRPVQSVTEMGAPAEGPARAQRTRETRVWRSADGICGQRVRVDRTCALPRELGCARISGSPGRSTSFATCTRALQKPSAQ